MIKKTMIALLAFGLILMLALAYTYTSEKQTFQGSVLSIIRDENDQSPIWVRFVDDQSGRGMILHRADLYHELKGSEVVWSNLKEGDKVKLEHRFKGLNLAKLKITWTRESALGDYEVGMVELFHQDQLTIVK